MPAKYNCVISDDTTWNGKITPVSPTLLPDLENPEVQLLFKATKLRGSMLCCNRYRNRTLTSDFSFFTSSLPSMYKSTQFLPVLKSSLNPTLWYHKALLPAMATVLKTLVYPHCIHALIFHALNTSNLAFTVSILKWKDFKVERGLKSCII